MIDENTDKLLHAKKKAADGPKADAPNGAVNGSGSSCGNVEEIAGNPPRKREASGLISTPPDVIANLNSAESAFKPPVMQRPDRLYGKLYWE